MAAKTRLGLWGHNTRPEGSFSKAHPGGIRTRLGLWGHNTRRAGSFSGKTPDVGVSAHAITRLGLWGHNTRLTGAFAGKAESVVVPPVEPPQGTIYRAPFLRLHQEFHYEYKPDGGLVFSGSAICQRGKILRGRDYLPQIGGSGIAGSAVVSGSHSLNSAYSGSGGLSWGGQVTVTYHGQRVQHAVGSGGLKH